MGSKRARARALVKQALVVGRDAKQLAERAVGAAKARRAPTFEFSGTSRAGSLTVQYRGAAAHRTDVERLFFTGPVTDGAHAREELRCEVEEAWPWQTSEGSLLVVQPWVDAICHPTDAETWFKDGVNSDVRRKIKKSQQLGAHARPTRSAADAARFYREMLEPMAKARFGETATFGSLASFLAFNGRTAHTELLFLEQGGEEIAAVSLIISVPRNEVRVWAYGMQPRFLDDAKTRADLMAALNVECVRAAVKHGCRLNFGFTRPYLDDGVQIYKSRWGAKLVPAPMVVRLALRFRSAADQVRFVTAAPLLHLSPQGIAPVAG